MIQSTNAIAKTDLLTSLTFDNILRQGMRQGNLYGYKKLDGDWLASLM